MSLEAAILEHAAAVRELAAALTGRVQPYDAAAATAAAAAAQNAGTVKPIAGKATGKASAKIAEPEAKTAEPEPEAEAPAEDTGTAPDVSVDVAAAKVTALVGAGHRPAVVALLAKYDAKNPDPHRHHELCTCDACDDEPEDDPSTHDAGSCPCAHCYTARQEAT